jgi:hypothetical protein
MERLVFTLLAKPWIPALVIICWVGGCLIVARIAEKNLYEIEEDE